MLVMKNIIGYEKYYWLLYILVMKNIRKLKQRGEKVEKCKSFRNSAKQIEKKIFIQAYD